jgi:hypothetical protein
MRGAVPEEQSVNSPRHCHTDTDCSRFRNSKVQGTPLHARGGVCKCTFLVLSRRQCIANCSTLLSHQWNFVMLVGSFLTELLFPANPDGVGTSRVSCKRANAILCNILRYPCSSFVCHACNGNHDENLMIRTVCIRFRWSEASCRVDFRTCMVFVISEPRRYRCIVFRWCGTPIHGRFSPLGVVVRLPMNFLFSGTCPSWK